MRGLRIGTRVAVIAWGLVLAASLAPPVDSTPEPARARLQAVAVETPEPHPAEEPAAARPAPVAEITAEDLDRGAALLSGAGRFPVISASYEGLDSFGRYAAAMTALGARFAVVQSRAIVAEIDLASGAIREASLDRPFSPRARDYSDEPALAEPARRVRERFGPEAEIMLLVPRSLDAGLFGGIARELAASGDGHAAYRELEGRYERGADGSLRFHLVSGLRMDGRRVALGAVFDLGALILKGARG
jgi:hypothetical protein